VTEQSIETENSELLSPRDLRRDFANQMERLAKGEVEKLVLIQRGKMAAVVIPFERYVELVKGE
jgi:antitoxin (DNA-binding transcriptional repressor) of toxin-antitoxin stability system